MERLIQLSQRKAAQKISSFQRYLHDEMDWGQRLNIILGHRGTGKTTMMLQRLQSIESQAIYLSLDDFYFEENRLVRTVENLYEKGVRHFFLDEVHRYAFWSKDLKNLHDSFTDIFMVATGSSILDLVEGQADLSRRAVEQNLAGLSFREFLSLSENVDFPRFELGEILENHPKIAAEISDKMDVLSAFRKYLKSGYFPFFKEGLRAYPQRLLRTVDTVLAKDIAVVEELNHATQRNMKKLLYVIAQSVPFVPNIAKLADKIGITRNSVLRILDLLHRAGVITLLRRETKGISYLQKPEKIYLQNPNLAFALSDSEPNIGNLRETFFLNQLSVNHKVTSAKFGDFMVDGKFVFEIGGAGKTAVQIQGVPNAFIAADEIKIGQGHKIPLWLFGFLY